MCDQFSHTLSTLPIIVGAEAPQQLADMPLGSRTPGLPILLGLVVLSNVAAGRPIRVGTIPGSSEGQSGRIPWGRTRPAWLED